MSKTGKTILRFFAVTAAFILFRELVDRLGWKLALALDNGVLDPDGVRGATQVYGQRDPLDYRAVVCRRTYSGFGPAVDSMV